MDVEVVSYFPYRCKPDAELYSCKAISVVMRWLEIDELSLVLEETDAVFITRSHTVHHIQTI